VKCLTAALYVLLFTSPARAGADEACLLDAMQRRCFRYFQEQVDPDTGLIADRAPADGSGRNDIASIAATGFGLTAVCIADERGWIAHDAAYRRALTSLRFLWQKMPQVHGYFYHFVNIHTGERVWKCEVSTIDTALLMAGVLTARQQFKGTQVEVLARKLYERVEWSWMLNGHETLRMGWRPERGFSDAAWDDYNEHMILELLGLGSPTHPLAPGTWHAWRRQPVIEYEGMTFLACPPLFTHQFSHAWVDFRGKRDDYADYWRNSVLATKAHRLMCIKLGAKFPDYSEKLWGITASDSQKGYTAWGGPPETGNIDGTVVPCAAAGSIAFLPAQCIETLEHMKRTYRGRIWKRYGFVDAFNPRTGWVDSDVIGIDKGITLLMIENHRSGFVWKRFMANPEIQRAMEVAGFRVVKEGSPDRMSSVYGLKSIPATLLEAARRGGKTARVRRFVRGWERADWRTLDTADALESGQPVKDQPIRARFALLWDEAALHLRVDVTDDEVMNDRAGQAIHEQDCVEWFIDPQDDGLRWGDEADYQFGFAVTNKRWEWFGGRNGFEATTVRTDDGYRVNAAIPWEILGVKPGAGVVLGVSLAVKDVDTIADAPVKLNWQWRSEGDHVRLGKVVLR